LTMQKNIEKEEVKEEFRERLKRERISIILFAILIASGFIVVKSPEIHFLFVIFALIGNFLYSLTNWRCPKCNAYLGGWGFSINIFTTPLHLHCPKCGIELRSINKI
jgi:hypothetical protein